MHGGASTGPRTQAGLERMRRARTRHGYCGGEGQAFLRSVSALLAEGRRLVALAEAQRGKATGEIRGQEPLQSGETPSSPPGPPRRRKPTSAVPAGTIGRDADTDLASVSALPHLRDGLSKSQRNDPVQSDRQRDRSRKPMPGHGTDGHHEPPRTQRRNSEP
jgi:hypothetical protein